MRHLAQIFTIVVTIGLPFIIYGAHKAELPSKVIWGGLILLYGLRYLTSKKSALKKLKLSKIHFSPKVLLMITGTVMGIIFISLNKGTHYLYIPVLINGILLFNFSITLFKGPPIVEIFARRMVSSLSPPEVVYCKQVTILWVIFFILNGGVIFYLAWQNLIDLWALYTGFISYMLMGTLFFFEMTYRYWRFRNYGTTPIDSIYKKIFPVNYHDN